MPLCLGPALVVLLLPLIHEAELSCYVHHLQIFLPGKTRHTRSYYSFPIARGFLFFSFLSATVGHAPRLAPLLVGQSKQDAAAVHLRERVTGVHSATSPFPLFWSYVTSRPSPRPVLSPRFI